MDVVVLITAIWLLVLYVWLWWDERRRKSQDSGYVQYLQQTVNRLRERCLGHVEVIDSLQARCKRDRGEAENLRALLNEQFRLNIAEAEAAEAVYRGKRKPVKKRRK